MHANIFSIFDFPTTHYCVTRRERVENKQIPIDIPCIRSFEYQMAYSTRILGSYSNKKSSLL